MRRYFGIVCLLILISCSRSIRNAENKKSNEGGQFRVMSYNIHHANPPARKGVIDLDGIAATLSAESPDFIALQEVDVLTRRSGKLDEAQILATKLGMFVYFANAIDYDSGDYGVAILSKYPIQDAQTYKLPTVPGIETEPRVLAKVSVTLPNGRKIIFGSTHLDSEGNNDTRKMQIEEIKRIVINSDEPFVLAGDFNATPESSVITALDGFMMRSCVTSCGYTFPVITPKTTIDYIAVSKSKGLTFIKHEVVQQHTASDHLPIFADIKY